MALVMQTRWEARTAGSGRGGSGTRGIDRVDGLPSVILDAWGVPLVKRYDGPCLATGKALDNGRRFDLSAKDCLEWETVPASGGLYEFGGVKERIVLGEKPTSPQWRFRFETPPGVRLHYQGELTPEEIARGNTRPPEIVGSYAVYDASGCKIGHFLRPHATDANGKFTWLELSAVDGPPWGFFLTIRGVKAWFDAAKYPVVVDPTFGYTTVGASSAEFWPNIIWGFGPETPASSGNATDVRIYGTGAANLSATLALYAVSTGLPGSLLRDGGGVSVGTGAAAWYTDTLDSPVAVVGGTSYYLGQNHGTANFTLYYDASAVRTPYYKSSTTHVPGSLSSPFPSSPSAWTQASVSIYATYNETAAFKAAWAAYSNQQIGCGA